MPFGVLRTSYICPMPFHAPLVGLARRWDDGENLFDGGRIGNLVPLHRHTSQASKSVRPRPPFPEQPPPVLRTGSLRVSPSSKQAYLSASSSAFQPICQAMHPHESASPTFPHHTPSKSFPYFGSGWCRTDKDFPRTRRPLRVPSVMCDGAATALAAMSPNESRDNEGSLCKMIHPCTHLPTHPHLDQPTPPPPPPPNTSFRTWILAPPSSVHAHECLLCVACMYGVLVRVTHSSGVLVVPKIGQ